MESIQSKEQKAANVEREKVAAFDKFMSADETKLIVSLIPESNPPEALRTLLRKAFDSGSDHGSMTTGNVFFEALISGMTKTEERKRDQRGGYTFDNGSF